MYSQNREEIEILKYFKNLDTGIFLDIGAFDGETYSNTRQLALNGWKGICVEPEEYSFKKLKNLYFDRKDIECFQYCIGDKNEIVKFYDSNGNACSTTDPEGMKKFNCFTYTEIWTQMITLDKLLELSNYKIFDFISIDIENDNLGINILKNLDIENLKVKMICAEGNNYYKNQLIQYLENYKFEPIFNTPENILLIKI
jgi:FkbM family methyltransferase